MVVKWSQLVVSCLLMLCVSVNAYAYEPRGWLFGDEFVKKATDEKKEKPLDFNSLTPDEQVTVLHSYTLTAIHAMDVNPTPENAKNVAEWLQFWTGKATGVVQSYRQMLLENPELDYHLAHPSESAALSVTKQLTKEKEISAIASLSKEYGLFYFYEGRSPYALKLSPIIKHFAETYKISVLPVSVDGVSDGVFSNTRANTGQAERLGITHFPALILVNPQTQEIKPLSYGFITEDALANRFYQVSTGFKGETY